MPHTNPPVHVKPFVLSHLTFEKSQSAAQPPTPYANLKRGPEIACFLTSPHHLHTCRPAWLRRLLHAARICMQPRHEGTAPLHARLCWMSTYHVESGAGRLVQVVPGIPSWK